MNLPVIKHEDERRVLTEWLSDIPVKRCKVIEAKGKVTLGNHYHNKNDSVFFVFRGKAQWTTRSTRSRTAPVHRGWLHEGESLFVPRGMIHTFVAYPGTVMFEAATETYDPTDEIPDTI